MKLLRYNILRRYGSWNGRQKRNTYFVTTPIYYVNACPHIGHLYSSLIADASYRFKQLLGCDVTIFSTGTDEHGTKVQEAAAKNQTSLPEYCANMSQLYKSMSERFDIGYTDYIRTTEDRHKLAVHHFWGKLRDSGYIYPGEYSGWYCVSDETFLAENQVKEVRGADGRLERVSVESGQPVEWTTEQNFMFRLESMQGDLLHWLGDVRVVRPAKFHKMVLGWVGEGSMLHDVSVSRSARRVHWGIPVPGTPDQTVYVWLDALVSYLTAAGYPQDGFLRRWPPDLQVIGKDILKFHGVYWPAFLLAAGLETPRTLLCHSHWTVDGEKMSKSRGNAVDPAERAGAFTEEGLRYFLLREATPHSDANYNDTKVARVLNSELADTLGNLLNRCCGTAVNQRQVFPQASEESLRRYCQPDSQMLLKTLSELPAVVGGHFSEQNFYRGVDAVMSALHVANRFFESAKPWELCRDPAERERLEVVLHVAMETVRVSCICLQPIVPRLANLGLNKLGVPGSARMWSDLSRPVAATAIDPGKVTLYKRIVASK